MHKRDCRHCGESWFLNKQRAENRWESSGRDTRALGRPLRTTLARTAQAHDVELALAPMGTTVRSNQKDLPGIGAAQSTERWKKPRSTQIDAAAREEGDRSPPTSLSFTCLDLAPNKKR